ncbi:MAG: 8-amino-7-oxononanoate synthase [Desulfobacteraceae bacterium]|nr:MAG: 8-amino-7-oxononanoate synthase [Desulfobacteraceae bacterium]
MKREAGKLDFFENTLAGKERQRLLRALRPLAPVSPPEVLLNGRVLVNFSSNDYLGLSRHPLLIERAAQFMERFGAGSTGSRLVCGDFEIFEQVERRIADLKGTEAALIFNSGFQANVSMIPALSDPSSVIFSDRLNHNSIVNGARLARCRVECFRHNDMEHLRMLLQDARNGNNGSTRILIITESVFSVDGDQSDLDRLVSLSREHGALLIVDDAHATGVLGKRGMGLTCGKGVDVAMGTFSKACGGFGAYVACSGVLREYLINCCSGFIYSTALPPAVLGTIDAALDLIPSMDAERERLHENGAFLRKSLQEQGWSTASSTTHIVPVVVGEESKTLSLSRFLEDHGILAPALRPPTVEPGKARIRFSLSSSHTREQVESLVRLLASWRSSNGS